MRGARNKKRATGFFYAAFISGALLAMLAASQMARAEQPSPARPFAPWMTTLEDDLIGVTPAPAESSKQASQTLETMKRRALASREIPDTPVITPEQTKELMEKLDSGAKLSDLIEKPSAVETAYEQRINEPIKQFGYDVFGARESFLTDEGAGKKKDIDNSPSLPAGAVQDDFILNIGDKLTVTFRGQRSETKTYTITGEGFLLIDDLTPVSAAGRTIGDVRNELRAQTALAHNTEIFVALESVRQINVLVIGHVKHPGRVTLTVFDSVLDALLGAGGIEKTGSLRRVGLVRGGHNTAIDLYDLFLEGGGRPDLSLHDGDRILVPPVGPTVAIAGGVKRPGIYEILPVVKNSPAPARKSGETLSLQEMLEFGGGLLNPGQNRLLKMSLTEDGRETIDDAGNKLHTPQFTQGSILMVAPAGGKRTGNITLEGETRRPGIYALAKTPTLSSLLSSEKVLGADIYPLIGVIDRWNRKTLSQQMIAFPPGSVLDGAFDHKLQDGDKIILFSRKQMRMLQNYGKDGDIVIAPTGEKTYEDPVDDPAMAGFLRERFVFVRGAVRHPGGWPVAESASLENLLAVTGGMTLEASASDIEITTALQGGKYGPTANDSHSQRQTLNIGDKDPATVILAPGDSVRVNQRFRKVKDNSVLVIGEVRNPGRYDLLPGDRLSDLLQRAGSLTPQAYPDGAIFSRESERRAEEARFKAESQELELKLAAALQQKDKENAPAPEEISAVQNLIGQLKKAEALGRITVEADPGALKARPDEDILLESGDRIYIPQRPLTVRVAGEILSPASLQFRKDKEPDDYIAEAGGLTYNADKSRSFVMFPDGSAQPLQLGSWNHNAALIPPGSTIVVPRDPKPFDFIQTAKDISQILSNLAITGIFIDNIRNEN